MTEQINKIPARLKNMAKNGHVAGADDIIDDTLNKTQDRINQDRINDDTALRNAVGGLTQSKVIVGALPASGAASTIYRVPGTNSYSDYAWNGSQFVLMATYNNAIDDVPTADSDNLVKSGGIYKNISYPLFGLFNNIYNSSMDTGLKHPLPFSLGKGHVYQLKASVQSSPSSPIYIGLFSETLLKQITITTSGTQATDTYTAEEDINNISLRVYCSANVSAVSVEINDLNSIDKTIDDIDEKISGAIDAYDKTLLFRSNISTTDSLIVSNQDIAAAPIGSQIVLEITELSGSSNLKASCMVNNNPTVFIDNLAIGKYYFERTSDLYSIKLEKFPCTGNKFNYTIHAITKDYPVINRLIPSYLPAKQGSVSLGTPFQGYYSGESNVDAENVIQNVNYWVSYPIQKTTNFVININCSDFTNYVVILNIWNAFFQRRQEVAITQSTDYNLQQCIGWNISLRRTNYQPITPAQAEGVVTVTYVSGVIYEKPLLKYEVEKIAENKSNAAIATPYNVAKQGYGMHLFAKNPYSYHYAANSFIFDADGHAAIASQSIEDNYIAARLGFSYVEANAHITSDGHYICIHGNSGKFGTEVKSINQSVISTEDLQNTDINSVTLDWIKSNVRYNSYYTKYQTSIPTLEEFMLSCKANNLGVLLGSNETAAINICRKYLGNKIILYGAPTSIRNTFTGWVTLYNNSNYTVSQLLTQARNYGAPFICGLGPTAINYLKNNGELDNLISAMHAEGFLLSFAAVYHSEKEGRKLFQAGFDCAGAGHEVNPFEANYEIFDLDDTNHQPVTTGIISNSIITLASGQTVSCGSTDPISLGKGYLSIQFNGELTINFGSIGTTGRNITSDGSEVINISDYFFNRKTQIVITANDTTNISYFVYKTSRC